MRSDRCIAYVAISRLRALVYLCCCFLLPSHQSPRPTNVVQRRDSERDAGSPWQSELEPTLPILYTHQPDQNQFAEARNAAADFCFPWSSRTTLQTSTHSLQMYVRMERSDGFEMSVSTWSWVLLQNEHLRISSWRLRNISPVWRRCSGSQDPRKSTLALLIELRHSVSPKHRKILRLDSQKMP